MGEEKIYDSVVIGAGVVGLAITKDLSDGGQTVLLVEKEDGIGQGTSSRNSEIIHSGLYYTPGTLRAKLCVAGKHLMYEYCTKRGVNHRRVGKLLVAADEKQAEKLRQYMHNGAENKVELQWLGREEALKLEPKLRCHSAVFSPTTGIVDSHGLMQTLLRDSEAGGAHVALSCQVVGGDLKGAQKRVEVRDFKSGKTRTVSARHVVNAGGLHAQEVARSLGVPHAAVPERHLAKGNYFSLKGKSPFNHLIYPMPNEAGLGTHLSLDMAGNARFGPDVQYTDQIEYSVDPSRGDTFYAAIREYWPELPDRALQPSFSGIRPKLHGPGTQQGDFVIDFDSSPGCVHLYGIESPGLTSSLAMGQLVVEKLLGKGSAISSKL